METFRKTAQAVLEDLSAAGNREEQPVKSVISAEPNDGGELGADHVDLLVKFLAAVAAEIAKAYLKEKVIPLIQQRLGKGALSVKPQEQ